MFIQKYQCPLMSFENLRFTGVLWILVESTSTKLVFLHRLFLASGIILVVFICLDSFNQILRIKIYKYYVIHVCHIFCVIRAKDDVNKCTPNQSFQGRRAHWGPIVYRLKLSRDCVQIVLCLENGLRQAVGAVDFEAGVLVKCLVNFSCFSL